MAWHAEYAAASLLTGFALRKFTRPPNWLIGIAPTFAFGIAPHVQRFFLSADHRCVIVSVLVVMLGMCSVSVVVVTSTSAGRLTTTSPFSVRLQATSDATARAANRDHVFGHEVSTHGSATSRATSGPRTLDLPR